ncbi:hypothetical protein, partial [Candidatus Methylacidiphilum fumarolicum]|uniref:hypothetical protein n=1 Tax=Candidatus Methylacidiphilum fumarolicum TaxID=591154 RepID=UPI001E61750B
PLTVLKQYIERQETPEKGGLHHQPSPRLWLEHWPPERVELTHNDPPPFSPWPIIGSRIDCCIQR